MGSLLIRHKTHEEHLGELLDVFSIYFKDKVDQYECHMCTVVLFLCDKVLGTVQSALHFTSLADLFAQIPSRLLWETSSHMLQLMREGCSYTYPPMYTARYSCIQLSELEQCRVNKLAQGFNIAAQDSNSGSRSRESEALPMSLCALCKGWVVCQQAGNSLHSTYGIYHLGTAAHTEIPLDRDR